MALEPPFSYCSEVPGPSGCRPLHGLSYPWVSGVDTIDALTWRRLNRATPHPGDALSGQPVDFPPWAPWMGPTICLTLTLTLVNARGRDGIYIYIYIYIYAF